MQAKEAEEDLYALLGIEVTATTRDIEKAYRIKSLKCHPDKVGPDNPEAGTPYLASFPLLPFIFYLAFLNF